MIPPIRYCICLAILGVLLASVLGQPGQAGIGGAQRTDYYGDPLPTGVVVRLGTTRWRVAGYVYAMDFSPDGRTLLTGGADSSVDLWDVVGAGQARRFDNHHPWVTTVAFAVDGRTFATAGPDGSLRLCVTKTGEPIWQCEGHEGPVACVAIAPDGQTVASCSGILKGGDATLRMWDAATGKELHRHQHKSQVHALAFCPAGRSLVSGCGDGTIHVWEVATGGARAQFQASPPGTAVSRVVFAPDGRTLAVAGDSRDPTLTLCDAVTGAIRHRLRVPSNQVTALAFVPDGKALVTASGSLGGEMAVILWDVATGQEKRRFGQPRAWISALALSRDGALLAVGTDTAVHLWRVADGKQLNPMDAHEGALSAIAFAADGKTIVTGGHYGAPRLWEAATGKPLGTLPEHAEPVRHLAFASGGKHVVAGGAGFRVYDAATRQHLHTLGDEDALPQALTADGKTAVTNRRGLVQLWETATGKEITRFTLEPPDVVLAIAADAKQLVIGSSNPGAATCRLWDVAGAREVCSLDLKPNVGAVSAVSATLAPDGKTLATTLTIYHDVVLWDAATGKELRRLPERGQHKCAVAFSPDGSLMAVMHWDYVIRVYAVGTGKELARFAGYRRYATALAFSPDGTRLAAAGADSMALVWEIPAGR